MSQPICTVTIDTVPANVVSLTIDEPDGGGGGTCQIVLAKPIGIDPDAHIVATLGYRTARGDDVETVFDSAALGSSLYAIEVDGDTVTASWGTRLDARFDIAPSEQEEVFKVNRGGLHAVIRHVVCTKIGYSSFRGNIPNVAVPREITFSCSESYWTTLTRLLTGFKPLVLPDDALTPSTLYLYWLDGPLHGDPRVLPFAKAEAVSYPKEIRQIVNQALIRYYPQGRDGRRRACSGQTDTFVSDATGHVIATSGGDCGDDHVDLETDGPSGTATRVFREDNEDGTSNVTHHYRVWPDGREVEFKTVTVLTRTSGATRVKLAETTVNILHLAGTNYETVSGYRSVTHGLARRPGIGEVWVRNLKVETEVIDFFQIDSEPGVWKQHTKRRKTRGYALYPERVPLEVATTNDGVDASSSTYQYDHGDVLLRTRNEYIASVTPTQMLGRWEEIDELRGTRSGEDTSERLGRQASKDDEGVDVIEELVQDETSITANGARTAIVIDATWMGAEVERPNGAGSDATIGRDWAISQALAMFRRSGKGIVTLNETLPKYFRGIRRGSLVRAQRRAEGRVATYLVTGRRVSFVVGKDGTPRLSSEIRGRRAANSGEQS